MFATFSFAKIYRLKIGICLKKCMKGLNIAKYVWDIIEIFYWLKMPNRCHYVLSNITWQCHFHWLACIWHVQLSMTLAHKSVWIWPSLWELLWVVAYSHKLRAMQSHTKKCWVLILVASSNHLNARCHCPQIVCTECLMPHELCGK